MVIIQNQFVYGFSGRQWAGSNPSLLLIILFDNIELKYLQCVGYVKGIKSCADSKNTLFLFTNLYIHM